MEGIITSNCPIPFSHHLIRVIFPLSNKYCVFLNAFVNTEWEQIIQRGQLRQPDYFLNMLSDVQIGKGNYFDKLIHVDRDTIVKDIRVAHKGRCDKALDDPNYANREAIVDRNIVS